jgi:hypothetical protein
MFLELYVQLRIPAHQPSHCWLPRYATPPFFFFSPKAEFSDNFFGRFYFSWGLPGKLSSNWIFLVSWFFSPELFFFLWAGKIKRELDFSVSCFFSRDSFFFQPGVETE